MGKLMKRNHLEDQLAAAACLEDPVRRALYFHVGGQPEPVSRDQAAGAVRVSRAVAAFHLDKLVDAGLLEASFRRLSDRSGPGAGRPSKLYRRSAKQIEISVPERRYELAGELMAAALAQQDSAAAVNELRRVALERGKRLGAEARARSAARAPVAATMGVLRDAGFEPTRDGRSGIVLRNCPFDCLARCNQQVVCAMNLALIEGVLAGLGIGELRAGLEPRPGFCCVTIRDAAMGR
jgi:predicted ArsR family transcriptional regulator